MDALLVPPGGTWMQPIYSACHANHAMPPTNTSVVTVIQMVTLNFLSTN